MKLVNLRRKLIITCTKYLLPFFLLAFIICFTWDPSPRYEHYKEKEQEKANLSKFRPWYFENGVIRPSNSGEQLDLWPNEAKGDRILNQLMFIPKVKPQIKKKIFVEKLQHFKIQKGSVIFDDLDCPVKECEVVSKAADADAVIFKDFATRIREKSTLNQIWILHLLESPFISGKVIQQHSINWTASYRMDSDLVTPYDKWVYYDESKKVGELKKNYADGKIGKIAWFVSNCNSKNKRLQYAKKLSQFISVDIYGLCGDFICLKDLHDICREMITKNYKFYLSFENANCRDYITEKFFLNGLRIDVIPIVMGAPKEDYEKVAPLNSFIHVEDFESPKQLAEYLHYLDENDEAYNSYFLWKETGEFINTYFMCRLCAMLHADRPNHYHHKIMKWWRGTKTCTKTFWNATTREKILLSLSDRLKYASIT